MKTETNNPERLIKINKKKQNKTEPTRLNNVWPKETQTWFTSKWSKYQCNLVSKYVLFLHF